MVVIVHRQVAEIKVVVIPAHEEEDSNDGSNIQKREHSAMEKTTGLRPTSRSRAMSTLRRHSEIGMSSCRSSLGGRDGCSEQLQNFVYSVPR